MIPEFFWVIGFYTAAAALVHWAVRRATTGAHRPRHYVLVAGNHQLQIEGYVRALQQFSRCSGTEIGITVLLENSSDETAEILKRFAREDTGIGYMTKQADASDSSMEHWEHYLNTAGGRTTVWDQVVWVQLACAEDLAKLPRCRRGA
ncbi:hypothetical protein [Cohnella kolymensis]|uniref:hypothetical protein n=1 Tax=Cohnella kolymensis TaxID=1590652 RepID=UPI0006976822|nr:hypothetical protein [Cohnella kolymensis]